MLDEEEEELDLQLDDEELEQDEELEELSGAT